MLRERKKKTRTAETMERQVTLVAVHTRWHDDLQLGFSTRQPRIHQGNQIHGFGCPAFEIGTTWLFFLISSTEIIFCFLLTVVTKKY